MGHAAEDEVGLRLYEDNLAPSLVLQSDSPAGPYDAVTTRSRSNSASRSSRSSFLTETRS